MVLLFSIRAIVFHTITLSYKKRPHSNEVFSFLMEYIVVLILIFYFPIVLIKIGID